MTALSRCPLRRFVIAGLRDTIDCYAATTLPLHRFTWELGSRLSALAEVTTLLDRGYLATLRAAHHTIAAVDQAARDSGRADLLAAEQRAVTAAIATLRATLSRLDEQSSVRTGSAMPARPAGPRLASGVPHPRCADSDTAAPLPVDRPPPAHVGRCAPRARARSQDHDRLPPHRADPPPWPPTPATA